MSFGNTKATDNDGDRFEVKGGAMFSKTRVRQYPRQQLQGFSLIELLFVVTIIGIIASMTVPGVRRARQYANSGSAIQSLRTITSAEYMYERTHNAYATLNTLYTEGLIHGDLGEGYKSDYTFVILVGPTSKTFTCKATPDSYTGLLDHFFVDESGVIRFNTGASADATSDPIAM